MFNMFRNGFPNTDFHELNASWLLQQMMELKKIVETFIKEETITFADPIEWNITTQYSKNTVVLDENGNAFLSIHPVPSGIQLNNTDYWLKIFDFINYQEVFDKNITFNVEHNTTQATHPYVTDDWLLLDNVLYKVTQTILVNDDFIVGTNITHFTIEDFIKAFTTWTTNIINQYKNDIDASELTYKNDLVTEVNTVTQSMQGQLDAAIAGVTVDSEVINARIGFDGTTYSTLGEAIRTQAGDIYYNAFNVNGLSVDIEKTVISSSAIANAASKGVTVTITGRNTFTLSGTATANFWLDLDWGQRNVYAKKYGYLIKRNDLISYDPKVNVSIGYEDTNNNAFETDIIRIFNRPYTYKFPSDARTIRNTLNVKSGATFNGVTFEIIVASNPEFVNYMLSGLSDSMSDNVIDITPTLTAAAGYYDEYAAFNVYSDIWTGIVDIDYYNVYYLNYRAFYGVCETVFYDNSNNILRCDRRFNDGDYHENVPIMPPTNAVKMMIQMYGPEDVVKDATKLYYLNGIRFNNNSCMPIFKKYIAYNGDSISEGRTNIESAAYNGGAYPEIIARLTNGTYENRSLSGAILASAAPSGTPGRFIVSDIINMTPNADLICFEGGLNDYWLDVPLGTFDPDDYTSAVNDATVCGAVESIFRQATAKWLGKPICFVIPHRAKGTKAINNAGYTFNQMREKIIAICHKYSIPYFDAYTECGINGYNDVQSNAYLTAGSGTADGIHPNERCYKKYYVPQLIDLFNKIMPR